MEKCQVCGRGPARQLVIRRHVGMLLMQKFFKIKPTLCRECGTEIVWDYTTKTLVQGWWGPFSLVIALKARMSTKSAVISRSAPQR